MYSCPLISEKNAVHRLLRLLNWHVVIELTSVKKRVKTVQSPSFTFVCPNKLSYIETTEQFVAELLARAKRAHSGAP